MQEQPNPEELASNNISIVTLKPSQIKLEDYERLGLTKLIAEGYGYNGTPEELLQHAKDSFEGDDVRKTIFLAMRNNKAVGVLMMLNWTPTDKRGSVFADKLSELNPVLGEKFRTQPLMGCDVSDITTLPYPDIRGRGIPAILYHAAVSQLHPAIVVGQTKTVGAVITRAKALGTEGYRTFYGDTEVTPEGREQVDITTVRIAYSEARNETPNSDGVWYVPATHLPPTVPDVTQASPNIQKAFEPVSIAQNAVGKSKTAVQSLLSIRADLLQ